MMPDTVGNQLQQARQEKGLSLEQAAAETHIRVRYLVALEAGDHTVLPSAVQERGFLRLYAGYLGLPERSLLEASEVKAPQPPEMAPPAREKTAPVPTPTAPRVIRLSEAPPAPAPASALQKQRSTTGPERLARSQGIFAEIGVDLRRQRELVSLSLPEVERNTRLRVHYLAALEDGRMEELPSLTQARGMLANYTHFLNLDGEAFLLRFAEALQARREELAAAQQTGRHSTPTRDVSTRPIWRRFITADMLVGGSLIVILVGFVIWGASQVASLRGGQAPSQTAPAIADVLLASPSAETSTTAGATVPATATSPRIASSASTPVGLPVDASAAGSTEAAPTLSLTLPAPLSGDVQVYVVALQRVWMQVTVDNAVKFNGRTVPGSAYPFAGSKRIELLTGNGAGLQVLFNTTDVGILGNIGQVVDLIFTPGGMLTPTPTAAPTATRTPWATVTSTMTPKPTSTLRPTPTP